MRGSLSSVLVLSMLVCACRVMPERPLMPTAPPPDEPTTMPVSEGTYQRPTQAPLPEVTLDPQLPMPPLTPMPPPSAEGRIDLGPPVSQPAEIGRTYVLTTGHCGLDDSIDFDGSYWTVSALSDDPTGVSINSARGTIMLESHDVAFFRSGAFAARLARLSGTQWGQLCM